MKNGTHRSSGNEGRSFRLSSQDLMDAYASLRFRERRRVKMLAIQRGIPVEEMLVELTKIGLGKMVSAEDRAKVLGALPDTRPRMPQRRKAD